MRLLAVVVLLASSLALAESSVGPLGIGIRSQITRLESLTHSLDAGLPGASPSDGGSVIEGTCIGAGDVRAVWFKVGEATGSREVMIRSAGQTATVTVTPHAWNRHLFTTPIPCTDLQIFFSSLAGSDAELELLPPPGYFSNVRDDGRQRAGLQLKDATRAVVPGLPAVVLEHVTQGDDHAEAVCAQTVPQLSGSGYTHYEEVTLSTGSKVSQQVIIPASTSQGRPTWIELLALPIEFDGGAEVRWSLTVADGGTVTGLVSPLNLASNALGAEFPANIRFASHPTLDAGTSLLTLEVTRGEAHVFYGATDLDPNGRCGAVSRMTWRGTLAGEWVPDSGHRDLLFQLWPSPSPSPQYRDVDEDRWGDTTQEIMSSRPPVPGFVATPGDCDDTNPNVSPGQREACNGIDDDCDGQVDTTDPGFQPTACPEDAGICRRDHRASECVDGGWVACAPEPVERSCNGLDDDCDGLVDEGLPGAMCALQLGVCAGSHLPMCMPGSTAVCTAVDYGPGFEASETTCDGLDNDCDGHADALDPELAVIPCERSLGVCEGAARTADSCTSGGWRACDRREYGPSFVNGDAICDGLDNDCDGAVDEDCLAEAPKGCGCAGAGMTGTWLLLAAALLGKRRR